MQGMDTMATINLLQGRSNNLEEETLIRGRLYSLLNLPIFPCSSRLQAIFVSEYRTASSMLL